jgi:dihydrofolate reductase
MRKIIAAFQVSLDGYIEGPNGELDWIQNWEDSYDLLSQIDTCILGRKMYPGYEQYWRAILANPESPSPFTGKVATKGEMDYAHFADRTPHVVLSTTLDNVTWKNTRIARDIEEIRKMKHQPGKDIYAVGGATFFCALLNQGLIDELRLSVQPIVLGSGTALFKDVNQRHPLRVLAATKVEPGMVSLTYST